jgi:hypothetical protein
LPIPVIGSSTSGGSTSGSLSASSMIGATNSDGGLVSGGSG